MPLLLFQRDDCHLCDLALGVLAQAGVSDFDSVFIDQETQWQRRYGLRVPVLRSVASGEELDWPFDVAQVRALLTANAA